MSAHWYWDWDWSSPPTTQPARIEEEARAKREERDRSAANAGQQRPDDGTKKPVHCAGDQAPFPFPSVKPCQKVQVYVCQGTTLPNPNPKPHYPPNVNWQPFLQQEQYLGADSKFHNFSDTDPVWNYWIACEPPPSSGSDCCPKGCVVYTFMTKLPVQRSVNGVLTDVYIQDFKCQCQK
ncbi:MAG TPA: hypothetical protein VK797_19390 [Tepidisphaeraceae bacterium]|jgi:hypothetical protein|nr:hypothetical protein [Tepidisphaeraceae bacterium]